MSYTSQISLLTKKEYHTLLQYQPPNCCVCTLFLLTTDSNQCSRTTVYSWWTQRQFRSGTSKAGRHQYNIDIHCIQSLVLVQVLRADIPTKLLSQDKNIVT